MDLPTLYKSNARGKTQQWTIGVIGDNKVKPENSEETYIMTVYGVVDGKMVTQKRKVVPKGKKSAWEQAVFNTRKKWEDRQKKEGYLKNINDINNKRLFVTPMLAQTVKSKIISSSKVLVIKYPCHVQPKLDGHRCIANLDDGVKLRSRNNIEYKGFATLKNELLRSVFMNIQKNGSYGSDLYLDGELMVQGVPFEELSSQVRRSANHEDVDLPDIEFHIFDCYDTKHPDTSFEERSEFLMSLKKNIPENKNIKFVPTAVSENQDEIMKYYSQYMAGGYEGIMIRVSNSAYKPGKRPACLKKYKEFHDSEFEIVGYKEAMGEDRGTVIWVCKTESGDEFSCRPRGSREKRREWFNNGDNYIGKNLTVVYQELTEIGIPRFPVGKDIRERYS